VANNVLNYIIINNTDENVLKKVKDIFELKTENPFEAVWTAQLVNGVFNNIWPNGEEDYDREWLMENCGAKWFNGIIADYTDDTITLTIESAWDPIMGWVEKLAEVLSEIKSDIWIQNTFEDENYILAGVQLAAKDYSSDEYIDMEDWDVTKFWEDDVYRESYQTTLIEMMKEEIDFYNEHLKDLENE